MVDASVPSEIPADRLQRIVSRYPPADQITPADFEHFVAEFLEASGARVDEVGVRNHVVLRGVDGDYDFDAVATFETLGMDFRVVIEAKRHRNPIKRELVQVLHAKMISVGAQKALLVAAGKFQSGAIEYALAHGIALATLSEGRLTFETKSADAVPPMSVERADELGFERYAAMATVPDKGVVHGFRISPNNVESFSKWVKG